MTPRTDPRDPSAYDRFNVHERHERDLSTPDRNAVHTAAQPRARWSWGEWLTLAAIAGCLALGTSHLWWPLLHGGW